MFVVTITVLPQQPMTVCAKGYAYLSVNLKKDTIHRKKLGAKLENNLCTFYITEYMYHECEKEHWISWKK